MSNYRHSGDGELAHLDVEDSCGCAEVWETASEYRTRDGDVTGTDTA